MGVQRTMVLFFQIILLLVLGYGAVAGFMWFRQEMFLFYPPADSHIKHGYTSVEGYSLKRTGVTLQGWLVNPSLAEEKLLIYYGGNGEDVFYNIEEYEDIHAASLFTAYRGYGPSSGRPGEQVFFADALAVFDEVVKKYSPGQVFLVGRSLGSGIAAYVSSKREVDGTILITPYDSLVHVARDAYPWLPVGTLLRHRFESSRYLSRSATKILIIYGGKDRVVRPGRTRSLIQAISGPKEVLCLPDADHGTVDMYPEYWERLLGFINQP